MNKTLLKISANSLDFAIATGYGAAKKLTPIKFGDYRIKEVLEKHFPDKPISLADGYFNIITLDEWKEIFDWWGQVLTKIKARGIKYNQPERDCLLPNTPLIVKIDEKIQIRSVEDLFGEDNVFVLDKNLETDELQWTKINWIESKESNKDIITVKKRGGLVQTTEDHKFYLRKKWTQIGEIEKLNWKKMEYTHIDNWDMFTDDFIIDKDLAFVYGVFMADGTCGCTQTKTTNYCWQWHIDMFQKDALERCKIAIEKQFNIPMEIVLYNSQKKGSTRGGFVAKRDMYRLKTAGNYGDGKKLVEIFKPILYNNAREKIVPNVILNTNKEVKRAFLDGFLIGDGYYNKEDDVWEASVKSPSALLGLQIIANKIGWDSSISYDKRSDCPEICIYERELEKDFIVGRKIIRENRGNIKVYDINTDSGHFFAGNFLVHNCDNYSYLFSALIPFIFGINTANVTWGSVYSIEDEFEFNHYWNTPIYRKGDNLYLLGYEPMYNLMTDNIATPVVLNNRKYYPGSFRLF